MKRLPVYLLAGGQSRRFGSDKARAMLHGQPLLRHVAAMLEPVATSLTVVADVAGKYQDLGFRTIADRQPGLGPLAGLDTALHDLPAGSDWLLLCCGDAAVIRRHWLDRLLEACAGESDAVAFGDGHWQPMPGLYARSAAPVVAQGLAGGRRSMKNLLDALQSVRLPLPLDWPEHWQVNTRQELDRFEPSGQEDEGSWPSPTAARVIGQGSSGNCHEEAERHPA